MKNETEAKHDDAIELEDERASLLDLAINIQQNFGIKKLLITNYLGGPFGKNLTDVLPNGPNEVKHTNH